MNRASSCILAQDEVACNLHGNHGRKNGANDVEKARNVIHRIEGCRCCAEYGHANTNCTPRYAAHNALA